MSFRAILALVQGWLNKGWNVHFCRLSWNWVLKVDLGTHLRVSMDTYFYEIWSYFGPCSKFVKPKFKICTSFNFLGIEFWMWIYVPIWEISMETYFYEIWSYFGPHLRLKICILSTFWEFKFQSRFRYPFQRSAWTPIFMIFGAILALVQGWSNHGWKYALFSTFLEFKFWSRFRYPFC